MTIAVALATAVPAGAGAERSDEVAGADGVGVGAADALRSAASESAPPQPTSAMPRAITSARIPSLTRAARQWFRRPLARRTPERTYLSTVRPTRVRAGPALPASLVEEVGDGVDGDAALGGDVLRGRGRCGRGSGTRLGARVRGRRT